MLKINQINESDNLNVMIIWWSKFYWFVKYNCNDIFNSKIFKW